MTITYQECRERPDPLSCQTTTMKVPFQPKIHRVKCLLANGREVPDLNIQDSERAADEKLNNFRENEAS